MPPAIADLLDLFVDAHAAHAGIGFEEVLDFVLEGIELGGPWARMLLGEGIFFQGPADGLGIEAQLSGDELSWGVFRRRRDGGCRPRFRSS